ncbi:GAF domain-containing protein [Pseudomarimonas salicorniae]|uniref:GAF domain-containing protein n=1 Tax=Pseudomarimonas salicorniae TaxID=2933270 RepID=A0ABT0GJ00_9GAMM|nr:GAF domain-containing protein [Lysobacter sp. CAU 1642]MCK7594403.1 GAF domain-containing protein [Lysobacter sp. CAU 1642]
MPARIVAHLPEGPAVESWVADGDSCLVGRAAHCTLVLRHPSVSREHLLIESQPTWRVANRSNKNGTQLDGRPVDSAPLTSHHWLQLGDVTCEFQPCGQSGLDAARASQRQRQQHSTAIGEELAARFDKAGGVEGVSPDLLDATLQAVIQLAECERGFLLLRDGDGWRVAAQHDAPAGNPGPGLQEFSGSHTAIRLACERGEPVVINDARGDPRTRRQASVLEAGIRSLLALPLQGPSGVVAALYVDRRELGHPLTEFDVGLAAAFAERAAVWLAARDAMSLLKQLPRWESGDAEAA